MKNKDELIEKTFNVLRSRNTRNIVFLVLSVLLILLINSLLPVIEGSAHYTEAQEEMTYGEYKTLLEKNKNYNLTWTSKIKIEKYISEYCDEHPELGVEDKINVEPPDTLKVEVYTKFFFSYAYWWLSTLTHVVSVLVIYYSVFNYILSKRKLVEPRYLELTNEVNKAVNEELDPVTFEPWMANVFNKNRKIKQHISNTKYALDKLNKKTSYKIRHSDINNPKYQRYLLKKNTLEEQLEEEYIQTYVPNNKVKGFVYIHPTFVASGYNVIGHSLDSYSLLKSDAKRIGNDSVKKVTTSILITTLFAILLTFTIGTSIDKPWYWILINVVVKLAPLTMQIHMASDYCDSFMDNQLITNLLSRRSIALLYMADMKKGVLINNGSKDRSEDRSTNIVNVGDERAEQDNSQEV